MIRHISIFEMKEEYREKGISKLLSLLADVAESEIIEQSVVKENIANVPEDADEDTPSFGELVQIIDFASKKEAAKYPQSLEHMNLLKKSRHMINHVTVIEFEV